MKRHSSAVAVIAFVLLLNCVSPDTAGADDDLREQAAAALNKAATFFRTKVAVHGGYVYYYSLDLQKRWGEGVASPDQIWVQPPGTPTVGMAYLKAFEATGDRFYLQAATEAAEALVYGQLQSGGWTSCIDFNPSGKRVAQYRNGKGRGKNNSSLDDGQTQSAIRLLMHVDGALRFRHEAIRDSARIALDALLEAQFPNGAFPQVWDDELVPDRPVLKASYPDYDWRTEGRIKEYWDMYTLNDNVCGYVAETLIDARRVYDDDKYEAALRRLGDFLLLAQIPEPQPGWAQQYNYEMRPIWARKFEPPAVAGDESQETLETLIKVCRATGDRKYLEPFPRALAWLKRSRLPDGRLARYYELKTNRPLYMVRRGDNYTLTYDDSDLPGHYGWKIDSRLDEIEGQYRELQAGARQETVTRPATELDQHVRQIISDLDEHGRWIAYYRGELLVGQPKFPLGSQYISSDLFSRNLTTLSEYLIATRPTGSRRAGVGNYAPSSQ